MSRATCFVITCTVVILTLFVVFCYLMSTVNPPQIKVEEKSENITNKYKETNLANFYLRNMDPSEDLEYGLEKSYDSPSLRASPISFHQFENLTNMIPTVKHKNPHLVKVYPPIWPPTTKTILTSIKETQNILTATTIMNTTTTSNVLHNNSAVTEPTTPTTKKVESPIHRRSINAFERKIDRDTGSVVLKILDDDGQSRIEIKLSPNEIFEKKKSRMHRSSLKDAKFSMVIEGDNKDVDINKLPENTEIRIMPNDTVSITNDVYDLGGETTDYTNQRHENTTDNNNNDIQYTDNKFDTLFENKTVEQLFNLQYQTYDNTTENNTNDTQYTDHEAVNLFEIKTVKQLFNLQYQTEKTTENSKNDTQYTDDEAVTLVENKTIDQFNLQYQTKNKTENNTNDTQYTDYEAVTLVENKTVDIENILYTESTTVYLANKTTSNETDVVRTAENPNPKEEIDFEKADNIKAFDLKQGSSEVFGLKVMFDNVNRSLTEPYDFVLENKTIN